MNHKKTIKGFSKLSKTKKISWLVDTFFKEPEVVKGELQSYWLPNESQQKVLDGFSENTISNFPMPFSVAPNFLINDRPYCVPMVIEESSVVAAASSAAKFWMTRGGFTANVIDIKKVGQYHFNFSGPKEILESVLQDHKSDLLNKLSDITRNMENRGGGILDMRLRSFTEEPQYFQIEITFNTCDSMGANFINTVLEEFAGHFQALIRTLHGDRYTIQNIMCILSNYTPECIVEASVSCPIEDLGEKVGGVDAAIFAEKFAQAVRIAEIDTYRATTHNKGIYNGIDAVILATGNDFRAIEAAGHTYAARDGQYSSLSHCQVKDGQFKFWLTVPLAVGTVGGLTKLHPIAKRSLELLGNPSAQELMEVIAAVGLAQNFAAVRSLVTTGIQKGHMKMHLSNLLNQLKATEQEFMLAVDYFKDKLVSYRSVENFLQALRLKNNDIAP